MTLIITLSTTRYVVQVSDRRISAPGVRPDDNTNKAVYLRCTDADIAIAYTGVATFGHPTTKRMTDTASWLAEQLTESNACAMSLSQIQEYMQERIAPRFIGFAKNGPTCFVLCGYEYLQVNGSDKIQPFAGAISSIPCDFKNIPIIENGSLWIHGNTLAFDSFVEKKLRRLLASPSFRKCEGAEAAARLVPIIRSAAGHRRYGNTIGLDAMTAVILPDTDSVLFRYHPHKSVPKSYTPIIVRSGWAFSMNVTGSKASIGRIHFRPSQDDAPPV